VTNAGGMRRGGNLGEESHDRQGRLEGEVADGLATLAPRPHMAAAGEREADAGWIRA
jgi:hypothetical protein